MVCISPLTSLMMDQRAKYTPFGLNVEFIGEAADRSAHEKVIKGEIQLVFITPESIISKAVYRDMLMSPKYQDKLVALTVDEAHCVKTWGDQFRKTFAMIGELRSLIPTSVNILALTATATTETFHIVVRRLAMSNPTLIALPPNRDNISYKVHAKVDINELVTLLCIELKAKRCAFPKTLIFVRMYQHCSNLYMLIKKEMAASFTEPSGYPNTG